VTQSPTHPRSRSLRHIVFASLALVLLLLTAAQFLVTGSLTERQLLDIESRDAFGRLQKLHRAIDFLAEDLNATATDWAQWEQMHRFASGTYAEFPEYNLIPSTYTGLRLELVAIVDATGRVIFAKRLSDDGKALTAAPADFIDIARQGGALYTASAGKTTSGLIDTTAGAYLVSVQPILSYYGEPLKNARLIMGRSLVRFVEPSLERVTGETLDVRPPEADFETMHDVNHSRSGDLLRLDADALEGVTTLSDLWNRPVAQLHLHAARSTQALVRSAQQRLLIAALIIGVLFCLAALATVRHTVVDPLERLASAVKRMGKHSGADARVPMERSSHELETLSAAINSMVEHRDEHQAMRRDRDAAIEANRLKSEFLAIMSHEIRTPMNGVLGMCELLQHTELDIRQRRMSDTIVRSAQSLLEILNDILDFSKIEAGRLELEDAIFSPTELVASAAAPFVAGAQAKHIALRTTVASEVPIRLIGDALRLRQVIGNLLSNAVKFTERGSVSLTCDVVNIGATQTMLRFIVTDTGIGIPISAQEHIFDPFAQADSSTSRRFGGTGLGLAIVRRLATLMQGSVRVSSEAGIGATFTLTVPLRRAPEIPVSNAVAADTSRPTHCAPNVLLAEDNAVNREVLKEMLEHAGARVTVAENGVEALAHATRQEFDIIFMDCHMPVMDGLAAVARLREAEVAAGRSPAFVVALTADVTAENRERCIEVGMNELAGKPISQARLSELIQAA
jgi:signal transduction histidine kinase/CheY-like chemotaxis protein